MWAVISDVHGNYPALKKVLNEIDRIGCERILSLGDVSGYYCMINECIEEFRKRKVINLMGNHDHYLVYHKQCPRSATVNVCLEYQRNILTSENLAYLKNSPLGYDDEILSARHGGWKDPLDEYITEFDFTSVDLKGRRILASGHTHVQHMERLEDILYFNPGSVGQPRDRDCRAAFAILSENRDVTLMRVSYDIDEIANQMKRAGFPNRVSECLYAGTKIGG